MQKGKPLQNDVLDFSIRNSLLEAGVTFADAPHALRDYAVAGAVFNESGDLYGADRYTIENSALQLSRAGIPLHPETKFHFYNLLPPIECDVLSCLSRRGEDRLPKSDVLLSCGIKGGRYSSRYHDVYRLRGEQMKPYKSFSEMYCDYSAGFQTDRLVTVSRHQMEQGEWAKAADSTGAKIVVTRGPDGIDAINSHDFEHAPYRTLVDTREDFAEEHCVIGGGLGICIHTDYLEAHRGAWKKLLDKKQLPAERILRVLKGEAFERPAPPKKPGIEDFLREHRHLIKDPALLRKYGIEP